VGQMRVVAVFAGQCSKPWFWYCEI
jgi:hypothetical protein